jgi:hypothetical protein
MTHTELSPRPLLAGDQPVVSRLLDAVASGTGVPTDLFAADAVLDATVPHFRFAQRGPARVAGQLSSWFADPGELSEVRRTPVEDGEVVAFTLHWLEQGRRMCARQVHLVGVEDDRITRLEVWCGGRWDPATQEEIAAALVV